MFGLSLRRGRVSSVRTTPDYTGLVKAVWQGRVVQATSKYGEHAPMAAVCCNACRTCATTNIASLALAAVAGAGAYVVRLFAKPQRPRL